MDPMLCGCHCACVDVETDWSDNNDGNNTTNTTEGMNGNNNNNTSTNRFLSDNVGMSLETNDAPLIQVDEEDT
jgi:hypothetical protein